MNIVVDKTVVVVEDGGGVNVVDGVTVIFVVTVGRRSVPIVVVVGTLAIVLGPNCVKQSSSVYVVVVATAPQPKKQNKRKIMLAIILKKLCSVLNICLLQDQTGPTLNLYCFYGACVVRGLTLSELSRDSCICSFKSTNGVVHAEL